MPDKANEYGDKLNLWVQHHLGPTYFAAGLCGGWIVGSFLPFWTGVIVGIVGLGLVAVSMYARYRIEPNEKETKP